MAVSKQRISSPLEAGQSLLDAHNLPPHLTGALDYVSKRLARKALHITLVVVRKGYQLPSSVPPTPTSPPATPDLVGSPGPSSSAARFAASMSPVAGLRQLVRRGTSSSLASSAASSSASSSESIPRSAATSPAFPPPPTAEALASPRRWPPAPLSPGPRTPMTPHTPCSVTTTTTTTTASSAGSNRGAAAQGPSDSFGIRLVYTTPLSARAEKALRATVAKAERKFRVGTGWLLPPAAAAAGAATAAAACGLNSADLVRRSLLQNEVLFSSEGLTLLGLDRLYTFKSALAAYARAAAPAARFVEDAVDELRRLVLANGGRPVSRADLHRSYDWIGVNAGALADVERMYRRAYGGREQAGAFEVPPPPPPPEEAAARPAGAVAVVKIGTPPPPKNPTPVLKLNTSIAMINPKVARPKPTKPVIPQQVVVAAAAAAAAAEETTAMITTTTTITENSAINRQGKKKQKQEPRRTGGEVELEIKIDDLSWIEDGDDKEEGEEDGDRTALPIQGMAFWNGLGASIDEMMQQQQSGDGQSIRQSQRLGPMTPNGYDDISPITRGEWGFLFAGDGWKGGKTAAVETC